MCFSKSIPQENLNPIKIKISKNSIIIPLGKIQSRIVTVFFWGLYRSCLTYYVNLLIIYVTLTEKATSTCLFSNIWEIDWLIFYFVNYSSKLSFVTCLEDFSLAQKNFAYQSKKFDFWFVAHLKKVPRSFFLRNCLVFPSFLIHYFLEVFFRR